MIPEADGTQAVVQFLRAEITWTFTMRFRKVLGMHVAVENPRVPPRILLSVTTLNQATGFPLTNVSLRQPDVYLNERNGQDRIDVHGAQRPKILSSLFYVDIHLHHDVKVRYHRFLRSKTSSHDNHILSHGGAAKG